LDNPALFLAFRPSEHGLLTPLARPWCRRDCRQRPSRATDRHLDATQLLERLPALCVYLGRACSLAGDIGRQPSLGFSGIAKGEVAGWAGACPASSSTRNSTLAETQRVARDEVEDHHRGLTI